jgi:sugar/nucleoside kinase (ribokinase family)
MMVQRRVLVAGEINVDLILQGYHEFPVPGHEVLVDDFVMTLGSASAICAVGLAKLGTPVSFAGIVGADVWGDYCLGIMGGAGIDLAAVRRDARVKTGVTVSISSPSDRALVSYLGSIAALTSDDVDDGLLQRSNHLHVSSYFLQGGLRPGCRELFQRASRLGLTLHEVDLFFPNEVELAGLTGLPDPEEALRSLENGRTLTVAKLGARGAILRSKGVTVRRPAFQVAQVDTTGAGDSFNAGFMRAWLEGRPLEDALALGAACGAISTRAPGGTGGQATLDEAESLVRSQAGERGAS